MQTVIPVNTQTHQTNGNGANKTSSFKALLDEYEYPAPRRGEIIYGTVLDIANDALFIDIGAKRDAIVPHTEMDRLDDTLLKEISRGDEVPVYVRQTPVGDDELLVSLERGLQEQDWVKAEKLLESGEVVELEVINHNKGGLIVEFNRLQGFIPNSHIPEIKFISRSSERSVFKARKVGTSLPLKVIEINRDRQRLVFSATAVHEEQLVEHLKDFDEGQVVNGIVVNTTNYGAFVDVGQGVTGLLHLSKISWDHIDHPSDALKPGDEIEVMIDDIDLERKRISLNRKALMPGPWDTFAETHSVGDLVPGEVTAVVDFGAFIGFPENIQGLLHKSEMRIPQGSEPADVLQPGDEVLVRIISLDCDRQRMGLSMRRVSAAEEVEWMQAQAMEKVEAANASLDEEVG